MFPETIIQKISATDSSFHAKYRTKQKVQFLLVVLYNEVIKTNSNLFIFFFEKVLSVKKKNAQMQKSKNNSKLSKHERTKATFFMRAKTWNSFFSFLCFFNAQNVSVKNKINRLEIVLISSLYYTTDVYLYLPTYLKFVCTYLFFI